MNEQSHVNKDRKKEIVTEWYEVSDTWCVHEKPEPCDYFSVFSELKTSPGTPKWKHIEDLMFPSRSRWGRTDHHRNSNGSDLSE